MRYREFQGGHICDWERQKTCVSEPHPSIPPPAPSRDVMKPPVPYWVHLEVTAVIFNVDLGYTTSRLLIHLHRLDAILQQEKTPNQALLGESNLDGGRWASRMASYRPQSKALHRGRFYHLPATEGMRSSGCPPFSVQVRRMSRLCTVQVQITMKIGMNSICNLMQKPDQPALLKCR